jgi:glutamyl-tRNA reductase
MSEEYAHGRRDGLRLALAILAAEEAKWTELLGQSRSGRTNAIRAVRHKALQVAQTRVQTALNRLTPNASTMDAEMSRAIDLAGL